MGRVIFLFSVMAVTCNLGSPVWAQQPQDHTLSLRAEQSARPSGKLIVTVTAGENNEPAKNAVVYVRGYQENTFPTETSILLNASSPGRFEASLAPGLCDIFVSDVVSLPRSIRVVILANRTRYYSPKLDPDEEHQEEERTSAR